MTDTASSKTILGAIVVSGVTTFMFYPLITLELLDRGQTPLSVGLILGLLSGVGPTVSILLGQLNATWGSKKLSVVGLIFRSLGLGVFAFDVSTPVYVVGAIVASLSSASVALALKTELMRASTSRRMITLRSIMVNMGALVGPSIGGILFFFTSFSTIVIIAVASYLLLAFALLCIEFKPPETQKDDPVEWKIWSKLDVSFVFLCMAVFAYWAIYSLWPLVIPIVAKTGFGTAVASGWIYTGNAILILSLQYWLIVKKLSDIRSTDILIAGFAIFIVSSLLLMLPIIPAVVIIFATLFSLAEMLISPTLDEITGQVNTDGLGLTRAYGVTGTVSGLGSLIGAPLGGLLINVFGNVSGAIGLAVPLAIMAIFSTFSLKRREVLS